MSKLKHDLRPIVLTREAFAPFGDVIACDCEPRSINNGTTERFHDLAVIDVLETGGRPLLNIFRGQPFAPPLRIKMMERHPLGSQAFVPITTNPFLVVVAKPGLPPNPQDLVAFICNPDQGVNYARGTWHHPLISLNSVSDFIVIDRGSADDQDNLDEHVYPETVEIWLLNR